MNLDASKNVAQLLASIVTQPQTTQYQLPNGISTTSVIVPGNGSSSVSVVVPSKA